MFMFFNQCIKDQYSGRNARHNSMIQKTPFTKKTVGFGIKRIKISKPRVQGKKKNMFYILKVMSCAEVPKENFPPQSPGYKPADGQIHSCRAEKRPAWAASSHLTLTTGFTAEAQDSHGQIPSIIPKIKAAKSLNPLKNWGQVSLISEAADYGLSWTCLQQTTLNHF